jgi:hypothetical protein
MSEAVLFERRDEEYLPTELAGSPWHPAMLHGGAPAALMAYGLEQAVANPALQPTRLTIDLVRPIPKAPLRMSTRNLRTGKRIVLQEITLSADDKPVAIATGLFIQPHPVTVPDYAPRHPLPLPAPDTLQDVSFRDVLFSGKDGMPPGLHTTIQMRPASGLREQGQGAAWLRLPATILAGTANSPFMRAALTSDFSNGVGQLSLGNNQGTINADISLQLLRLPQPGWIGIDARTWLQDNGLAMVQAQLYDGVGLIGQVTQSAMPMLEYSR